MTDSTTIAKTISQTDSGFPPYLDFNVLRQDAVDRLGELTGKIWTDYNLHDPGITILEMLCYAVLDLGYRTQFPAADIFSRDPASKGATDFFTPAQILTCNPLTIADYRKMLVDVEGVRNAWLEVARDEKDRCLPRNRMEEDRAAVEQQTCEVFLNGLYHVYLELEDPPAGVPAAHFEQDVVDRVRTQLMAHRNLCEDFVDVLVLCKLDLGVCADIELRPGAEAAAVQNAIIAALTGFFSPAPRFYTLAQLLDKNVSIEDAFAGRPYDVETSYGFVDSQELDQIRLRKEIHLSDIYKLILSVPGVQAVRRLKLRRCTNAMQEFTGWTFHLPVNTVPRLSLTCSGLRFLQNGKPVHGGSLKASEQPKLRYEASSPYLNYTPAPGLFRADLADYYSIQNDFPAVYGIARGGLPQDAGDSRISKARQLKAYLLFFDQLLANYLVQLKQVRSLLSLHRSNNGQEHTYFAQQPDSVPELELLVQASLSALGNNQAGALLAVPVSRTSFEQARLQGTLAAWLQDLSAAAYEYDSEAALEVGVAQWIDDISAENFSVDTAALDEACQIFCITGSARDVILVSAASCSAATCAQQASLAAFAAAYREGYQIVAHPDGVHYSFQLYRFMPVYSNLLAQLAESSDQYLQRRKRFLDHLLARFAEQFTDYVLLSYGSLTKEKLTKQGLQLEEQFLQHYDEISSNRGKGMDYTSPVWKQASEPGFVQKVAAMAGFSGKVGSTLCPFVVEAFDERYFIHIYLGPDLLFACADPFYSREAAEAMARTLLAALKDPAAYQLNHEGPQAHYGLAVRFGDNRYARYAYTTPDAQTLRNVEDALLRFFKGTVDAAALHVSETAWYVVIHDWQGMEVAVSGAFDMDREAALRRYKNVDAQITKPANWTYAPGMPHPFERVLVDKADPEAKRFIDLKAFKIDIDDTLVGLPEKFGYELLDRDNNFKFLSIASFDAKKEAEKACREAIMLLTNPSHLKAVQDPQTGRYVLQLAGETTPVALSFNWYASERDAERAAQQISEWVLRQVYALSLISRPYRWKFDLVAHAAPEARWVFRSLEAFDAPEKAQAALETFNGQLPSVHTQVTEAGLEMLIPAGAGAVPVWVLTGPEAGQPLASVQPQVDSWLELLRRIRSLAGDAPLEAFDFAVENERASREPTYVYRVVDKDRLLAFYIGAESLTSDDAEEARKQLIQAAGVYGWIDICMGGDNYMSFRRDGALYYRYQLRLSMRALGREGPVLFESVDEYASQDNAQQAFDANYLKILDLGRDAANYGPGRPITWQHFPAEPVIEDQAVRVRIPEATVQAIGGGPSHLVDEMVKLCRQYPVRTISNRSCDEEEWHKRFPCLPFPPPAGCRDPFGCWYYFVLTNTSGEEQWQSTCLFPGVEAARTAFYYLLPLLEFPGNYVVQQDACSCIHDLRGECHCAWKIFIREVLLESTLRYPSMAAAWKGVEVFSCLAQGEGAFQAFWNRRRCLDSFFVACFPPGLLHPYQYNLSTQRDRMLQQLYQAARQYLASGRPFLLDAANPANIYTAAGTPLASLLQYAPGTSQAALLEALLAAIWEGSVSDAGQLVLSDTDGRAIAEAAPGFSVGEWRYALLEFAWYFPVRHQNREDGSEEYCIVIRFPDLSPYKPARLEETDCRCHEITLKDPVAWVSACCYPTPEDALQFYLSAVGSLLVPVNYYSIVDSDCVNGGFGIGLYEQDEIVAVNPQHYATPSLRDKAMEAALALVRLEGLHLVEHILLRPRAPEDCDCEGVPRACMPLEGCSFEWKAREKDLCDPPPVICFDPGGDPYSFIATAVLPAWPARFGKAQNRKLVEDLIYREAPAHVLLRILWLTPENLCRFEWLWLRWREGLSKHGCCPDMREHCAFLNFLFRDPLQCPEDCLPCRTCVEAPAVPCFSDATDQETTHSQWDYANQIDELFCWEELPCDRAPEPLKGQLIRRFLGRALVAEKGPDVIAMPPRIKERPAAIPEDQRQPRIDARYEQYRMSVAAVPLEVAPEVRTAALDFVQNMEPTAEQFEQVTDTIMRFSQPEARTLAAAVVFYYLDKLAFGGASAPEVQPIVRRQIRRLKSHHLLPAFKDWKAGEIRQIRPGVPLKSFIKLGW